MLWSDLPRDIPSHDYFPRYGPTFELISEHKKSQIFASYSSSTQKNSSSGGSDGDDVDAASESDAQMLKEANRAIELSALYVNRQQEKNRPPERNFSFEAVVARDENMFAGAQTKKKRTSCGGGRRRKKLKIKNEALL